MQRTSCSSSGEVTRYLKYNQYQGKENNPYNKVTGCLRVCMTAEPSEKMDFFKMKLKMKGCFSPPQQKKGFRIQPLPF